jgi:putative ABC transport system ATP-binding protein
MATIIETKNIVKTFINGDTETQVLKDIDLIIPKGEFTAIMGPSGSGKSTLLQILGLLDRQTSGEYFFDGKNVDNLTDDELAKLRNSKIGFIFQAFNLLPRTNVFENVKLPLIYSEIPEEKWDILTTEAIKSVGLEHRTYHESSQLSGGEKQRVAIARALVTTPEVIFADEPTGNLDSKSGQQVMEILQNLNKEKGHTIILITHEKFTAEHAERVIFIQDGQIKEDRRIDKQRDATSEFVK